MKKKGKSPRRDLNKGYQLYSEIAFSSWSIRFSEANDNNNQIPASPRPWLHRRQEFMWANRNSRPRPLVGVSSPYAKVVVGPLVGARMGSNQWMHGYMRQQVNVSLSHTSLSLSLPSSSFSKKSIDKFFEKWKQKKFNTDPYPVIMRSPKWACVCTFQIIPKGKNHKNC